MITTDTRTIAPAWATGRRVDELGEVVWTRASTLAETDRRVEVFMLDGDRRLAHAEPLVRITGSGGAAYVDVLSIDDATVLRNALTEVLQAARGA